MISGSAPISNGAGKDGTEIDSGMSRTQSQETLYTGDDRLTRDPAIAGDCEFDVDTDPAQDHRSTEWKVLSFKGPHMRAFHCSWFAFFSAFMAWFAIAPLMPTISKALKLTKDEIYISNICAISATIGTRWLVGPLCDTYGPRTVMSVVLVVFSIPTYLVGTVTTFQGFCTVRFFIGIIGSAFVMCQVWTSNMFATNIVGTANAFAAGWGNMGAGVVHLLMGKGVYPAFLDGFNGDKELAWRSCFVVPASITVIVGIVIYFISVDSPYGNYSDLKKQGRMPKPKGTKDFATAFVNPNCFLMTCQYAACFGTELVMDNLLATYFHNKPFSLDQETAALVAFSYGFMNIFSRGLGGLVSDALNRCLSMRGRYLLHWLCLLAEGGLLVLFAKQTTLTNAVVVLQFFAFFNEAACGTSYAIVPYIEPTNTGAVSGIVGSGGNMGAIFWGLILLFGTTSANSLEKLGWIVMGLSFLTFFYRIPGYSMLIGGKDEPTLQKSNSRLNVVDEVKYGEKV